MKYLKLFIDNVDTLAKLSPKEFKTFILALFAYADDGSLPGKFGLRSDMIWPLFRRQIDLERDTYDRKVCSVKSAREERMEKREENTEPKSAALPQKQAVQKAKLEKLISETAEMKSKLPELKSESTELKSKTPALVSTQDKDKDKEKEKDKDGSKTSAGADMPRGREDGGRGHAPSDKDPQYFMIPPRPDETPEETANRRAQTFFAFAEELKRRNARDRALEEQQRHQRLRTFSANPSIEGSASSVPSSSTALPENRPNT